MDDRGRIYTRENIREQLSLRDFMVDLADKGLRGDRPPRYGRRELKTFSDAFDRVLSRLIREGQNGGREDRACKGIPPEDQSVDSG
jgi:uncharacterized protein YaiI (UPF0178 family)